MCIRVEGKVHRDGTDCEELVKLAFLNIRSTYIALLKKDIAWYNEIYPNDPKTNHDFENDPLSKPVTKTNFYTFRGLIT